MQTVLLVLGILLVLAVIVIGAYLEVPFAMQGKLRREDMRVILVILGLVTLLATGSAVYYVIRVTP